MRSTDVTRVIGIALFFFIFASTGEAQIFPGGGLPMSFNGGFAGEAGEHRLVSSTHLDLSRFEKHRTEFSETFSYDVFVPSLRSGFGATAGFRSDHFNPQDSLNWELRNPFFSLAVSPKISFQGKLTLAPFVDFQFVHSTSLQYVHWNRVDPPMSLTNSRYTIRMGLLLNSEKGYVGLTVVPFDRARVPEPNYVYRFVNYQYNGADNTRLFLQAGRTFQKKNKPDAKFSFTPQIALSIYRFFNEYELALVDLNFAFRFNKFHTGVGAGGFQFAYDWGALRVGTSLIYYRPYRRGYLTFVSGQLTTVHPYQYYQYVTVRYLIDTKVRP